MQWFELGKIGYSNNYGVQEWVLCYGWTYTGTGDGCRYFAFSNYAYFQPDDLSTWWVTYSDGDEYKTNTTITVIVVIHVIITHGITT